jgi:hypothetical protein
MLDGRRRLTRQQERTPADGGYGGQPGGQAQYLSASTGDLRSSNPQRMILRLQRANPLPLIAAIRDRLGRLPPERNFHAA